MKKIAKLIFGKTPNKNYVPKLKKVTNLPFVSFIIPALNEEKSIEKCILAIIKDRYPKFEILIIDDNSNDNTPKIVKKLAKKHHNIKYFKNTKRLGPAGAKNKGIKNAKGPILIFMDAHSIIDSIKFTKTYIKHFSDPNVGAVAGGRSFTPRYYTDKVLFFAGGIRPWREMGFQFLDTPNAAIRKSVLDSIGGLDTRMTWGSDFSNTMRILKAGYKISNEPASHISIDHGVTPDRKTDFLRKPFFYGSGLSYVLFPYLNKFWERRIDINILLFGTINLVAIALIPFIWWLPIITIALSRSHSIAFGIYQRTPIKYLVGFPILAVSEMSYALGFYYGLIKRLLGRKAISY